MEKPYIIDEIDTKSKYYFKDGFYVEYTSHSKVFKDTSLHGKTKYQLISVDIESNLPRPDLAALKYVTRERHFEIPKRIQHYFEGEF